MAIYYKTYLLSQDQFDNLFNNALILENYFLESELSESLIRGVKRQQFLRGRWAIKCGVIELLSSLSISCDALDIEIKSKKQGVIVSVRRPSKIEPNQSLCIETSISHECNYSIALIVIEL